MKRRQPGTRRTVASGDTSPEQTLSGFERDRVNRNITRARTVQSQTLNAVLEQFASGDPAAQSGSALPALMTSMSPDDRKPLWRKLGTVGAVTTSMREADSELAPGWREGGYPYRSLMSRKSYEKHKYRLQVELLKLQSSVKETGARVIVLFEGRDAAGKGGAITRFMEHLNPRGEIVMFDRSGYNRAGVERVMGFCSDAEYDEFMRQTPEFERHLVRSGVHLFKFWFSVSREEQRRRLKSQ